MEVTVLGSGTAIPSPERAPPGYLVKAGPNALLMDCGPGSLRRAASCGVTPNELDAVLITHFHQDHVLDLQALLFALRSPTYTGRGPLLVVGPEGLREMIGHWMDGPQGRWLSPTNYKLEIVEIGEGHQMLCGLLIEAIHVDHTPQSLAYRLRESEDGPVLAYSGDTGLCDEIVTAGRGADLFVLECAVPDAAPFGKHLTPTQAAQVAERADPKRLLLTHFYPAVLAEPIAETVGERYSGEIHLAEDRDVFEV